MSGTKKKTGRKPGVPNKATIARQERIASTGATPLDVMIDNMRFAHEQSQDLLQRLERAIAKGGGDGAEIIMDLYEQHLRMRGVAQSCAKDAAPYVHPALKATALLSPNELDEKAAAAGRELDQRKDRLAEIGRRFLPKPNGSAGPVIEGAIAGPNGKGH